MGHQSYEPTGLPHKLTLPHGNCHPQLANVIVYIDDILVHSSTHEEHISALDKVLQRLVQHNIKINLQGSVLTWFPSDQTRDPT
jgi:hypothetical protein